MNLQSKPQARTGAAAVEMALVSTVLFAVILTGIELSRITMLRHSADYSAYVGARVGIITGAKATNIQARVDEHLAKVGIINAVVTVTPSVIAEDTTEVEVEVAIPASGNSWITPKSFTGSIRGRCTLLTERSALVMSMSLPSPPPPPAPAPAPAPPPPPLLMIR